VRKRKLLPALMAATALMAPAASAAAPSHLRSAAAVGCLIGLYAEPHEIASGESAQLFGRLKCLGGNDAGQTVTVYSRAAGSGEFHALGTTSTGAGGVYSLVAPSLTADTTFYASADGANSLDRVVRIAPVVTFVGPGEAAAQGGEDKALLTGVRNHRSYTFTGTVSPADVGAEVVLQRENATASGFQWFEEWKPIQASIVRSGGVYSITHTFVLPGDANLRVLVRPFRRFDMRGISNTLSYEISQPQNPALTLNASANPVSDGQSVTLTGKVAGGSNAPVTLTAHTDGNDPFAAVATTTTNANGEFSFVQSPTTSTYYQVHSASAKSAVQFEGVKYVLTAKASAEAVHSGEAVTFSGTVAPIRVGHIVYLERRNAGPRGGYHVVDTAAVSPSGTYTIAYYLFGSGSGVYRVAIPGDFANQATISQTFTIAVSEATPSLLAPVPQAKLPSEGKP
jgi:hypothetical protein